MTSRNLTLQPLVDKNGKVTSRWVKPHQQASSSDEAYGGVPTIGFEAYRDEEVTADERDDIASILNDYSDDKDKLYDLIDKMEDSTLRILRDNLSVNGEISSPSVSNGLLMSTWVESEGDSDERLLREFLTYADAFNSEKTSREFIEFAIINLTEYGLSDMDDYSDASDEIKQQFKNLLTVTEALYSDHFDYDSDCPFYIRDQKLVALIIANPDRLDDILDIARDRKVEDGELYATVLDSDNKALSRGHL